MNFSSISSSSCIFSSTNSAGDIRYEGIAIGLAPGIRSMVNSVSLTGSSPGISLGTRLETRLLWVGIELLLYQLLLPICLQSLVLFVWVSLVPLRILVLLLQES